MMSEKNMVRKMNLIVANMSSIVPIFFSIDIYKYAPQMCDTHSPKKVNAKKKKGKRSVDYTIHCLYLCCTIINKR